MNKILYIALLMSVSLACGVNTQLPYSQITPEVVIPTSQEVENTSVVMIVTAAEALNIRSGAGETFPVLEKPLKPGEEVTCFEFVVKGDSIWCRHELGWSNSRYMKGK